MVKKSRGEGRRKNRTKRAGKCSGIIKCEWGFVNCGKVQNEEFFCSGVPLFFGAFFHRSVQKSTKMVLAIFRLIA